MNNPNPFVPQGSLLEQQNKKRARVKVAVFTIFAANILVLSPLLIIQGCGNKSSSDTTTGADTTTTTTASTSTESNAPDTNVTPALPSMTSTSAAPAMSSNTVMTPPPPPPPPPTPPAPTTTEYTVVKGDSFFLIAKNNHVKMKELEAANPGVVPTKLKAGQKLQLPASATGGGVSGGGASMSSPMGMTDSSGGEMTYVVKPKDTLTKIAKDNGTTVKAIRAANSLKTDAIKVGQKLKVPQKAAPAPAPVPEPAPAPIPAPVTPTTGAPGTPGH